MIYNFKMSIKEYVKDTKNMVFPELYGCPNPECPNEGRMSHHGFYERNAIGLNGFYRISVHRYICPICKKTFSLLPSFLLPYYQYTLSVLFFCIFHYSVFKKTLLQIVDLLGIDTISRQHVSFYINRLRKNKPLCWPILFQLGCKSSGTTPFMEYWSQEVNKLGERGVECFSRSYFKSWGKSFLSLAS